MSDLPDLVIPTEVIPPLREEKPEATVERIDPRLMRRIRLHSGQRDSTDANVRLKVAMRELKEYAEKFKYELYLDAMVIEKCVQMAPELDDDGNPPAHWIEDYGPEEAARIAKIARDAMSKSANSPVYLEHAKANAQMVQRSLDKKDEVSKPTLHVTLVQQNNVTNNYATKDVENNDDNR